MLFMNIFCAGESCRVKVLNRAIWAITSSVACISGLQMRFCISLGDSFQCGQPQQPATLRDSIGVDLVQRVALTATPLLMEQPDIALEDIEMDDFDASHPGSSSSRTSLTSLQQPTTPQGLRMEARSPSPLAMPEASPSLPPAPRSTPLRLIGLLHAFLPWWLGPRPTLTGLATEK